MTDTCHRQHICMTTTNDGLNGSGPHGANSAAPTTLPGQRRISARFAAVPTNVIGVKTIIPGTPEQFLPRGIFGQRSVQKVPRLDAPRSSLDPPGAEAAIGTGTVTLSRLMLPRSASGENAIAHQGNLGCFCEQASREAISSPTHRLGETPGKTKKPRRLRGFPIVRIE